MNIKVKAKYKEDLQALDFKSASLDGILGQQSVKNRKPTSIYISLPPVDCKQGVFPEGWGGPGVHSASMDSKYCCDHKGIYHRKYPSCC